MTSCQSDSREVFTSRPLLPTTAGNFKVPRRDGVDKYNRANGNRAVQFPYWKFLRNLVKALQF